MGPSLARLELLSISKVVCAVRHGQEGEEEMGPAAGQAHRRPCNQVGQLQHGFLVCVRLAHIIRTVYFEPYRIARTRLFEVDDFY